MTRSSLGSPNGVVTRDPLCRVEELVEAGAADDSEVGAG